MRKKPQTGGVQAAQEAVRIFWPSRPAFPPGSLPISTRRPYRLARSGSINGASQAGAASASSSRAARSVSPTSSRRLRARTAASTWVASVRCRPPVLSRPASTRRSSISSSNWSAAPSCSARRARNSHSTEWWNPGSSSSRPIAYFQSILVRTASAAARSDRFSANCSTDTSANCPGDRPGLPLRDTAGRTPRPRKGHRAGPG